MSEDRNLLDKLKDKAKATVDGLKKQYGIGQGSNPWPQTKYEPVSSGGLNLYPNHKTRGFLPPVTLSPAFDEERGYGQYRFKDWRGHFITPGDNILDTKERFDESLSIPKQSGLLPNSPYSTRDHYLIFGDYSSDYFRHGLQIIDNKTPIENPENGRSFLRYDTFSGTSFENNDPIMYGFEIIIDDVSSPLLNGSILDFLRNYSNISEVASRVPVYEEFKQQFIKFFKTRATVRIDDNITNITKMRESSYPETDANKEIFQNGKKAYMSYYIKKVGGLDKLVDQNTPSSKKYLVEYNKDIITINFTEDVSLSVGTLAHLYKLLYWSKPNGKGIIPENLLRFNCDIIVSEVRNFKRVRSAVESGNIEIIKDNVSRYVYSLKECQFYFNSMTHADIIDLGQISTSGEGAYAVQFDYKYSTSKLERFVPKGRFGEYVGYDSGAIWKIGNPGARDNSDISVPRFYTVGDNRFNQNGVNKEFILSRPEDNLYKRAFEIPVGEEELSGFDRFKENSKKKAKELLGRLEDVAIQSASRELQFIVNDQVSLLNKTLNKIANSAGLTGIRPPQNIYTDPALNAGGRIFYDIRGELLNFTGDAIGGIIGGGINRSF